MNLALIFRTFTHWTTGFSYKAAFDVLKEPYTHFDNNDLFQGKASLSGYDRALVIDDGFGLQAIPHLPKDSVFVGIDYHNSFEKHYLPNLGQFRKLYAAQKTLGVRLLAHHGFQAVWLPMAWDDVQMPWTQLHRDIPITFVASWSTDRRKRLKALAEGYHGFTKECYRQEMGQVYSRSQLILNDFGMQTDWQVRRDHINQRCFEAMGCGGLLLTPRMGSEFTDLTDLGILDGRTAVIWDDEAQLEVLLRESFSAGYWGLDRTLAPQLVEIAEAGRRWVWQNHTYVRRVKTILEHWDANDH